jgi:hypothetical protein
MAIHKKRQPTKVQEDLPLSKRLLGAGLSLLFLVLLELAIMFVVFRSWG